MPLTISSIIFCSALMLTIQPKEKVEWQAKEREGHIWTIHGNGMGSFYFPIKAVSLCAIHCFLLLSHGHRMCSIRKYERKNYGRQNHVYSINFTIYSKNMFYSRQGLITSFLYFLTDTNTDASRASHFQK